MQTTKPRHSKKCKTHEPESHITNIQEVKSDSACKGGGLSQVDSCPKASNLNPELRVRNLTFQSNMLAGTTAECQLWTCLNHALASSLLATSYYNISNGSSWRHLLRQLQPSHHPPGLPMHQQMAMAQLEVGFKCEQRLWDVCFLPSSRWHPTPSHR